jgi:D-threo-aldose 1-dehydrogenase
VERITRIEAACDRHGVSMGAAALQLSMRNPSIDATIVGVTRPERVAQTLEWASTPIPDALWPELDELAFDEGDPLLDRW